MLTVDATLGVLANDGDVDGDALIAVEGSPPSGGTLLLEGDGSFEYVADLGFRGEDRFTYLANDGLVSSLEVEVVLTVEALPDTGTPRTGTTVDPVAEDSGKVGKGNEDQEGCGCSSSSGAAGIWGLTVLGLWRRRR